MKIAFWCLTVAAVMFAIYLFQGCDTIVNNFYGTTDAVEDVWVEPDESSPPDLSVDETAPTPPEDVEEEWAPGCDPPKWMIDPGWVQCEISETFFVDLCLLVWDKPSCTASCMDDDYYPPSYPFSNAPPEAISGELGCYPAYDD